MRTPLFLTCFLAIFIKSGAFADVSEESLVVHFEHDRYELKQAELSRLIALIDRVGDHFDYEITLAGHTDDNGSNDYNQKLSAKRTQTIRDLMVEQGLNADAISFDWQGEHQPEVPNSNETNRGRNRRVEISVTIYDFETTQDILDALQPDKIQRFLIDPNKDHLIEGRNGVQVAIAKHSLVYSHGNPVTEEVELQLTEALDLKQFMANDLSTISNNCLLVSAGMLKVEATTSSGEPLQLDRNSTMDVMIPAEQQADAMELFVSENGGNWEQVGQRPRTQFAQWSKDSHAEIWSRRPVHPYKPVYVPTKKIKRPKAPRKPFVPKKPRKPHKPRAANYITKGSWFARTFQPNSAEQFREDDYNQAVALYKEKKERYYERMIVYRDQMKAYAESVKTYNKQYTKWKNEGRDLQMAYRNSPEYKQKMDNYDQYYVEKLEKYKEEMKIWQAEYDEWLVENRKKRQEAALASGEEFDRIGMASQQAMSDYFYSMTQLGWINCDRFMNTPTEEKKRLALIDPDQSGEQVFLVFENIKSMLKLGKDDRGAYFLNDFPKNEPSKIFAMKVVNGKPLLCYEDAHKMDGSELIYRPTKFREIRKILEELNEQASS